MKAHNPEVETFFAEATRWRKELLALREILRACPLAEEFKWRSPCYTYEGGNVATVWGLKDCCGLSFFKGVLLKDVRGVLVAPGENSRAVRMVKFTNVGEIDALESVLRDYVQEAIELEKAGAKVEFRAGDLDYPEELTAKLCESPGFKAAFDALTPGRQRGYVLHFAQAKQSATRVSRIEKSLPKILAGKGLHDR